MTSRYCQGFWLLCVAAVHLAASRPARSAASPTAQLPIEPFSTDREVLEEGSSPRADLGHKNEVRGVRSSAEGLEISAAQTTADELQLALRVQMSQAGFGAQLRLAEFLRPWYSFNQTLRYFQNEEAERLFERNYGFYVGMAVQPWRTARLAPFVSLEGGWERFEFEALSPQGQQKDLFTAEAAAGLSLRLNRLTSFALQWSEGFFPGVKTALYPEQKEANRHSTVAVFLNMQWETRL